MMGHGAERMMTTPAAAPGRSLPGNSSGATFGTAGGPALAAQRPMVLAVDDEPDSLGFLEALLAEDFDFVNAMSGAQALERVRARKPDLVLTDFMMPGMNGLELCALLREQPETQDIPIIIVSAYESRHSSGGLYDQWLAKPVDAEALLESVRRMMTAPQ
jgi:CheY-like chemotaxis protein